MLEAVQRLPPEQIALVHNATNAELLKRRFKEFIPQAWPHVVPGTPFLNNWHIGAMAEHLQATTEGQITNLLINIPPRCMKSTMVAVMWPAWEWARKPTVKWLFTSYADDLSTRDAVATRRLLTSPWYQSLYANVFRMTGDQNEKMFYYNDKGGYRYTTTIEGQITGHGGDRLVLDDPHKVSEAESETERDKVLTFVDESWHNRYNDPKDVRRVIIMQRVHEKDASAHVLTRGTFVHLRLPMEYEQKAFSYPKGTTTPPNPLNFKDPRKDEAELLWPERLGEPEVKEEKKGGDLYWATQFQQRPYGRDGGMFNVDKLRERTVSHRPVPPKFVLRAWDLAATEKKTSKRTAGVRLARTPKGALYIEHVVLGKWAPDKRNDKMKSTADAERGVKILFEHEGGSSGEDQALSIARLLQGHAVEGVKVTGDKVTRADAIAAQVNLGNVWIVDDGTWDVEAFFAELQAFGPTGEYKDQVDALSLAYNWMVTHGMALRGGVPPLPPGDWRHGPQGAKPADEIPEEVARRLPQDKRFADPFGDAPNWRDNFPSR